MCKFLRAACGGEVMDGVARPCPCHTIHRGEPHRGEDVEHLAHHVNWEEEKKRLMTNKDSQSEQQLKIPKIPKNGLAKGLPDEQVQDQARYAQLILSRENLVGQAANHL